MRRYVYACCVCKRNAIRIDIAVGFMIQTRLAGIRQQIAVAVAVAVPIAVKRASFLRCNGENQECVLNTQRSRTFGGGGKNSTHLLVSRWTRQSRRRQRQSTLYPWNYVGAQKTAASKPAVENDKIQQDKIHSASEISVDAATISRILIGCDREHMIVAKYFLPLFYAHGRRIRNWKIMEQEQDRYRKEKREKSRLLY